MSYEVTVEPTGDIVEVEKGQTILDACLRQGVWLPFACCHGTCATCKLQLLEGDVDIGDASPFALMDVERDEGKILACCAIPKSDLVVEADIDVDPDFLGYSIGDFEATVLAIENLSPTIKGVRLQLDRDIQFQAGQYINLHLPGVEGARAFSIANMPSDANIVELHIRRVPDGPGTTYVHEQLQVGNELRLSGPYGQFFIRTSAPEPLIIFAGGSGLSSSQSMVFDLLGQSDKRQITLLQGARNLAELYIRDIFEVLAAKHDNFTYVPALDAPLDEDEWEGFTGYIHEAAIEHFGGQFSGHKAYLCGPPPMIDAAVTALMQGRLFERDIYVERFLTAADCAESSTKSALFRKI